MMSSLSEKDRKALRLGGIGVGVIVVLMVAVLPAMEYSDKLNARVADAEKKLRTAESNVNDAFAATQTQKALQEKVTVHPDTASLNRQTATMLQQVQRLPAYRTLVVQRLEGLPLRADEDIHRSAVTLQVSGTLTNLHQLLDQLGSAQPALKVDRLTVVTNRKNPDRIEGQMVISAYAVVARKGTNG